MSFTVCAHQTSDHNRDRVRSRWASQLCAQFAMRRPSRLHDPPRVQRCAFAEAALGKPAPRPAPAARAWPVGRRRSAGSPPHSTIRERSPGLRRHKKMVPPRLNSERGGGEGDAYRERPRRRVSGSRWPAIVARKRAHPVMNTPSITAAPAPMRQTPQSRLLRRRHGDRMRAGRSRHDQRER